jgi:hypothetical protein
LWGAHHKEEDAAEELECTALTADSPCCDVAVQAIAGAEAREEGSDSMLHEVDMDVGEELVAVDGEDVETGAESDCALCWSGMRLSSFSVRIELVSVPVRESGTTLTVVERRKPSNSLPRVSVRLSPSYSAFFFLLLSFLLNFASLFLFFGDSSLDWLGLGGCR